MDAGRERECRVSVPQIVQPDLRQSGVGYMVLEGA
jgi:hypothetical protein